MLTCTRVYMHSCVQQLLVTTSMHMHHYTITLASLHMHLYTPPTPTPPHTHPSTSSSKNCRNATCSSAERSGHWRTAASRMAVAAWKRAARDVLCCKMWRQMGTALGAVRSCSNVDSAACRLFGSWIDVCCDGVQKIASVCLFNQAFSCKAFSYLKVIAGNLYCVLY